jgi:hypothetical protein
MTFAKTLLRQMSVGLIAGFTVASAGAQGQLERVVERENVQRATAVVEAVNAQNRIVTIRTIGRDEVIVMNVSDEVRNLDQVESGDRVVVEFLEALAVDLKKGGGLKEEAGTATAVARAEPGEKPGGGVVDLVTIVATIVGIDPDEPSVLLQGPEGNVVEVLVKHPEKLKEVDLGDQVVITYSQALAISVTPAP